VNTETPHPRHERPPPTREAAGAPFEVLPRTAHLLEPVVTRALLEPDRVVAAHRVGNEFVDVTAAQLLHRVRRLAKGLIASGVESGDRVALMARSRLEWLELDYAILAAGAITVPVYETSASEQLRWIVSDSGAVVVVVETPAMRELLDDASADRTWRDAFVIDEGGLEELVRRGGDVTDDVLDTRVAALRTDDVATIIYTSGTTGRPKGCVLTHGNLRANVLQMLDAVRDTVGPDDRSLLFLPLAHAFSRAIAYVGAEIGIEGVFGTGIARLAEELPMARPTMLVAVPRVFEKAFESARQRADTRPRRWLFDRAAAVGIDYSRQRASGRVGLPTKLAHALFDRLVYAKLRAGFGGSLRFAFSGASALGERLTYFFDGTGVRVFEGYGLTETSPAVTVNRARAWRPGTVGRPLAGTTIRIGDDGEVLVKGPQVFGGYWRNEGATVEVFTADGWFRTGDIGTLDDGYLRITGRKKELIVTAGGKNVAPGPLEDGLRAHPLVSQALVIGDNRPFVAALVTIDEDAFATWRKGRGVADTVAAARGDPELRAAIQTAVDDVNTAVSRAESIRAFAILPRDFTVAGGEVTPTTKVRRHVVEARYADTVERLYSPAGRGA
jgi:long-chain acyl-CoA synthetase